MERSIFPFFPFLLGGKNIRKDRTYDYESRFFNNKCISVEDLLRIPKSSEYFKLTLRASELACEGDAETCHERCINARSIFRKMLCLVLVLRAAR